MTRKWVITVTPTEVSVDNRLVISWSELDTFHQCPWKWGRLYQERWTAPTTSAPLIRGSAWHKMLEHHYLAVMEHQNTGMEINIDGLEVSIRSVLDSVDEETADLLLWAYEGYLRQYGYDDQWRIEAVEWKHELPLDLVVNDRPLWLKLRADLVVKDGMGRVWIVDHKMQKDLPKGKELDLDDQFGLYTWAARKAGYKVFGSIHSSSRSYRLKTRESPLDERFKRTLLNRTDIELETLAGDAKATVALMASLMLYVEPGKEPRYTDPDRCRWRCPLTEACLASRKSGRSHMEVVSGFGFVQDHTRH